MKFDPVTFTLHDGRKCTLRSAEPEDAAALADYLNRIFGESPYLSRGAGEWTQTVEKETAWIESKLADPRSVLLLALDSTGEAYLQTNAEGAQAVRAHMDVPVQQG